MVFVGWDRQLERYFLTIADLCPHCDGTGDEPGTDYFCSACGAEGVAFGSGSSSRLAPTTELDEIGAELSRLGILFPDYVRADLERDRDADVGEIVHDYGQDPRRG